MKQIPDFGELIIKYRKPVEGCDPTSPMSAHKMSWRWEEGGTGNGFYVSDTPLGLEAATEYFKMLFEDAMHKISELQGETDDEGSERRVDGEADEERDKETDAED